MKLSVLTLSYTDRISEFLKPMMDNLTRQAAGRDVEVLACVDNLTMSVGLKWNALINAARGQYMTCVGDDDALEPNYVEKICDAIDKADGADCIVFDTDMYVDGKYKALVHWSMEHEYRDDWDHELLWRPPGELMCIKTSIRRKCMYPDYWRGSDWRVGKKLRQVIESEYRIEGPPLYHYMNRSDNETHTEMQKVHNRRLAAEGKFIGNPENVV